MKAILSGQAAMAVCREDNRFYSISLDSEETWTERNEWDIPFLFTNIADILQMEYTSRSEVLKKLETAWEQDRCLQLTLIALDNEEDKEIRIEATECLNDLLCQAEVKEYVENRLYSAPMPTNADLDGAIQLSKETSSGTTMKFLLTIQDDQEEILKKYKAWNDLPDNIFGETIGSKQDFYCEAVRYGAFRLFVTKRHKIGFAILQLLTHPRFRGISKARNVFQNWAASFKEFVTNIKFEKQEYEDSVYADADYTYDKSIINNHDAFQQAIKQREAIKKYLIEGDKDKAFSFTTELIESQRRNSKPEHIAKSLCDLAQFAKEGLGNPELQLEFAKRAVEEAPNDSWAYATLGDAYRLLAEYQKSLEMYHEAGVKSHDTENVVVALNGRAEVLKDIGQIEDALKIYEQCIQEYGGDIVSRNARAAALAHYGKLEQALEAYNEILQERPFDVIPSNGRAKVLNDMGRLEEALAGIIEISKIYPNDKILQQTYANFLWESGRLEDAEKVLSDLIRQYPSTFEAMALHAKILGDLGKFTEAIDEYKKNINMSPLSPWGYLGNAEIYRKMGELSKALDAYDLFINKFPYSGFYRNGKASVLVAMGKYSEALNTLSIDHLPASKSEWVAYHIRGMAHMRMGELTKAEDIFKWGLAECFWVSQREYFKTALASLRIRQGRYKEAVPLVYEITNPSLKPIANLLSMHAAAELNDMSLFNQSSESIRDEAVPNNIIELKVALEKRYKKKITNDTDDDNRLFTLECDNILAA